MNLINYDDWSSAYYLEPIQQGLRDLMLHEDADSNAWGRRHDARATLSAESIAEACEVRCKIGQKIKLSKSSSRHFDDSAVTVHVLRSDLSPHHH